LGQGGTGEGVASQGPPAFLGGRVWGKRGAQVLLKHAASYQRR